MSKSVSLICAWIGLAVFSAVGTQIKMRTIEQLAAADAVVHGTVVSKTCQRGADGRIFTRVQLQTKETWKGSKAVVTLVHAGGVLGEEAAFAEAQEQYDVGEEVVVFVRFNDRGEAVTVAMNQGKFTVFKHGTETLVHNVFHGASPADLAGKSNRKPMTLDELKARVQGGGR